MTLRKVRPYRRYRLEFSKVRGRGNIGTYT